MIIVNQKIKQNVDLLKKIEVNSSMLFGAKIWAQSLVSLSQPNPML